MALTDQLLLRYLKGTLAIEDELDRDSALFSSGMLDSMSMVSLIAFVEESAAIQVRSEDVTLDNFDTAGRIVHFVDSRT